MVVLANVLMNFIQTQVLDHAWPVKNHAENVLVKLRASHAEPTFLIVIHKFSTKESV
jgi:hypothetical protein